MRKFFYTYIVKCSDGKLYVGMTNDLERRIEEHNFGQTKNAFTFIRRPVELVWHQIFLEPSAAIATEKMLKKWSRLKKQALINENWDELQALSECKNDSHSKYLKLKKRKMDR